jgi:hypothetical protein
MPADLILRTYESESLSIDVAFTSDAFFNATAAAEPFGKRPVNWLALDSTKDYIAALCEVIRSQESSLLNVVRGGRGRADATWMHPDLAVPFCRWLDIHFAVWCDQQIKDIVQGRNPASANDTYRYHSLLLRSLRELARAEDGFGRTLLIDQIRFLCGRLGLPMPDPSLIGKSTRQTQMEV